MLESKLAKSSQRQNLDEGVDNSVPYPEAPEVEHGNLRQEHYRGARDPEQAAKRPTRDSTTPYRGTVPYDR